MRRERREEGTPPLEMRWGAGRGEGRGRGQGSRSRGGYRGPLMGRRCLEAKGWDTGPTFASLSLFLWTQRRGRVERRERGGGGRERRE
jgi:hypothetical protein